MKYNSVQPVHWHSFSVMLLPVFLALVLVGALFWAIPSQAAIQSKTNAVLLSVSDSTAIETNNGTTSAVFSVTLSASFTDTITVSYTTVDNTAIAPLDYISSTGLVTFTPGITSNLITVTIIGDYIDELNETFYISLSHAVNASIEDGLGLGTIQDNDTAGITVSPTSGLTTTETGGTGVFTVVLDTQPIFSVTVGVTVTDPSEGDLSVLEMTFTSQNWDQPQIVTIVGVDDFSVDGDVTYMVVTSPAISADSNYNGLDPADVSVTNIDNDIAGVTVTPTTGLVTTENVTTDTFTVTLNSQPTQRVAIELTIADTTEGSLSTNIAIFTKQNWNQPHIITVTGVDDQIVDGDITYTVVLSPAISADLNYNGVDPDDVTVINEDNDHAGIIVIPTSGLVTTEAGFTDTFTVVLSAQPTHDVVIPLSVSDATEGQVSTNEVRFNDNNWNQPQTVGVMGIDDWVDDDNITYTVVLSPAISDDLNYNGVDPDDVTVINEDNDHAGIIVTPTSGLVTTEAGFTDTFTVVLSAQPTHDVVIPLSVSDATEGQVSTNLLTFTKYNWQHPQTVVVTGVDDNIDDGDIAYMIVLSPAESADLSYNGRDPDDVTVVNKDNEYNVYLPLILKNVSFAPPPIFVDDFSTETEWIAILGTGASARVQSGEYYITQTVQNRNVRSVAPIAPSDIPNIYSVEVDARIIAGPDARFGLLFDWVDDTHFYRFIVKPSTGEFWIHKFVDGWQTIKYGTADMSNARHLTVERNRDSGQIRVFLNGNTGDKLLTESVDSTYTEGQAGVIMVAGTDSTSVPAVVAFDNFVIRETPYTFSAWFGLGMPKQFIWSMVAGAGADDYDREWEIPFVASGGKP